MQYDLLLAGSGVKFVALAGAYVELAARGHSAGRLIGSSGGAIVAALIAAGVTPQLLLDMLDERDAAGRSVICSFAGEPPPLTEAQADGSFMLKVLSGARLPLIPTWLRSSLDRSIVLLLAADSNTRHFLYFFEQGGWYSADGMQAWMAQQLARCTPADAAGPYSAMTFEQFYAATQNELSLLVSDATASRLLVLNHRTAPACPLLWAIRMSMSIPLYWPPVVWQPTWGGYRGLDISGHYLWDGSWLADLPLELLISDLPAVTQVMGPSQGSAVLGLLVDESLPVAPAAAEDDDPPDLQLDGDRLNIPAALWSLIDLATSSRAAVVNDVFRSLVASLPAGSYGTVEFTMANNRRAALIAAGRQALGAYLDAPQSPAPAPSPLAAVLTEVAPVPEAAHSEVVQQDAAPVPAPASEAARSAVVQRAANSITAAKELRDCRLPAALREFLGDALAGLGISTEDDQVVDQYAFKGTRAFVFTALRRGSRIRILLHFPAWILASAPEEDVIGALTYMGSAFRARTRELFICSEGYNYLPAPFTRIIDQYWPANHGITGRFVAWDSLAALPALDPVTREGELLKGVLNLEALLPVDGPGSNGALAPEPVLTGGQVRALHTALLSAYDRQRLRQMVRVQLDQDLDTIAGGDNLGATVFDLIGWAEREGKLRRLIDGALAETPSNPELVKFSESLA